MENRNQNDRNIDRNNTQEKQPDVRRQREEQQPQRPDNKSDKR